MSNIEYGLQINIISSEKAKLVYESDFRYKRLAISKRIDVKLALWTDGVKPVNPIKKIKKIIVIVFLNLLPVLDNRNDIAIII